MLSIQQLIKALRNLQSSGGDLVKSLEKHVAAAPSTKSTTAQAIVSSLLSEHDEVSSSQQQKNLKTNSSTSQQTTPTVDCQTVHTANASLFSHLNESGCSTTQDPPSISRNATSHLTQQIQKFHQQQLHYFHTHQSLFAKQKQTQFAMSSLAMTESLALKQDDTVAKDGGGGATDDVKQQSSPCFNTGLAEILQFMELIGNLKHTKRTGWVLRDVNDCESISGHMYRMSMMTFLLDGSEGLNQIRCMELALVHDLAESLVGDITPFCGVSREDKRAMEFKAMDDICKLIEPRGKRIMELFEEYEDGQSAESKFVKDLDRLDMVMQAFEYEKRDDCLLKHQEFFDSTEGKFNHPFVKKLVNEIYEQRKVLAKAKGATPPPTVNVPDTSAPTTNGHCAAAKASSSSSSS